MPDTKFGKYFTTDVLKESHKFPGLDVDRDTRLGIASAGKYVDGNNPDLKPFKKAGGKLIIISSWNSMGLPPRQVHRILQRRGEGCGRAQADAGFRPPVRSAGIRRLPRFHGEC